MIFAAGQTFSFSGRDAAKRAEELAVTHGPARVRVIAPGKVKLLVDYGLQPRTGPQVLTAAAEDLIAEK